jgi:hypothetical protein
MTDLKTVDWCNGAVPPDTGDRFTWITEIEDGHRGAVRLANGFAFNNYYTGPQRFLVLEVRAHLPADPWPVSA